jgi:cytochrome c-type biogenesis protein CcmH
MSRRLTLSWAGVAVVVLVALVIGATGDPGPRSQQERVYEIAATIKCPQCAGESVAESDAPISRQIRAEIAEGLQVGKGADQIRAEIAAGYEEDIRLDPSAEGVTGLVWVLPVAGFVLVAAGLVVVFRRWSRQERAHPTEDDQRIVDDALHGGAS